MKIVIGHKVLNLEELTCVAYLGKDLAEVVVDSQLYADLDTKAPAKTVDPNFTSIAGSTDGKQMVTRIQFRAALLVKLVQILKLKRNAQKSTVDFILAILNQPDEPNPYRIEAVSCNDINQRFSDHAFVLDFRRCLNSTSNLLS